MAAPAPRPSTATLTAMAHGALRPAPSSPLPMEARVLQGTLSPPRHPHPRVAAPRNRHDPLSDVFLAMARQPEPTHIRMRMQMMVQMHRAWKVCSRGETNVPRLLTGPVNTPWPRRSRHRHSSSRHSQCRRQILHRADLTRM